MKCRPLRSAPRDGTHLILIWQGSSIVDCSAAVMWWIEDKRGAGWCGHYGFHQDEQNPIGWLPLPTEVEENE